MSSLWLHKAPIKNMRAMGANSSRQKTRPARSRRSSKLLASQKRNKRVMSKIKVRPIAHHLTFLDS